MSPTITSMAAQPKGIRGKRVEGRPGRFDPTEPFHMSTRAGGRKSMSGGTPSANGSVEDVESRRPSLDAERPGTARSNGTQASKGTYASDFSPPQHIPDVEMSDLPVESSTGMHVNGERKSASPSPAQQTSPSTRKRKRSSPSPSQAIPAAEIKQSFEGQIEAPEAPPAEDDYDSDTVQVVRQDELSDREESDEQAAEEKQEHSASSSQSQEAVPPYDAMAGTSVDVTPIISEQPSPATSGSDEDEDQDDNTTLAKPLAKALKEVVEAKKDEPIDPEPAEDEPMLGVGQGIEDADDIEEQVRTDDDGRMVVRRGRFGGRRRAQHPNPRIEMAMRRQAQLKSAYRAIARAQKAMLAEVTERNIDDLEANPTHHAEVEEYEAIIRGLDVALAKRKATIQAQHEMRLNQLKVTWDGEQDAIVAKCRQQLDDVEETKVDQLQYEFLRIARAAQLEGGYETEDEDDVIPRPKRTGYHYKRGAGLDAVYDSRSRLAIETQSAIKDMQARYNMHELLKELPDEDRPDRRHAFAVMDERPRTAASKNREGQDALDMLVEAGVETERLANIPVIPNEQAIGLQMLSGLATRPSIFGGRPPSGSSFSGQTPGAPSQAPLHLQVPSGPSPIQVQMSPRTQHAMGNRFESSQMPPPSTPRQDSSASMRSPDPRRHERRPSSPGRQERANSLLAPFSNDPMRSPGRPQTNEAGTLQHRIASRDGMLQESLFGLPAHHNRRVPEYPGWRPFDVSETPRRRAASQGDLAPPFGVRSDPILVERHEEHQHEPRRPAMHEGVKHESTRFDPVRSQSLRWPDPHSQAGASNGRSNDTASPKSEHLSLAGTPGPQTSSVSGQESASGNKKPRHRNRESKSGSFVNKTSKAQRNGASRRNKKQHQRDNGASEGNTPTLGPAQFGGSPQLGMRAPSPWFGGPPPMHSPREFPPAGPYHHSGSYGPPPPGFPPPPPMHHHASFDLGFHHRNSFPPPPSLGWHPPPGSPLFHGPQQHPPPPGVPPEQIHSPFIPPPPPPGFGPPPPLHTPQTPHQQSAPGSGPGGQFRGPAIAPAGAFQPGGFRPANPPPAFAQQQQQNGGSFSSGSRRRTQSDVTFPKFQPPWEPKPPRH